MLGRPHEVRGVVDHGDKRARELGFRTANVDVPDRRSACPPTASTPAGTSPPTACAARPPSRSGSGRRSTSGPTPRCSRPTCIDFDGDLYGEPARVQFVERLRDELKFDSVEALVEQMGRDVDQSRSILTSA